MKVRGKSRWRERTVLTAPLAVLVAIAAGCTAPAAPEPTAVGSPDDGIALGESPGSPFEAAEALFRRNPSWLGADGANSTALGGNRFFWSFEDSFIATSPAGSRSEAVMVRNSVAVQDGGDPLTATMRFSWGRAEDGSPAAFFPAQGAAWYWTGASIRFPQGPLITFLYRMRATPGQGLGFANDGHALAVIEDPDRPVEAWVPRIIPGPSLPFDSVPATALLREDGYVVGLALRQQGDHAGSLVRYGVAELAAGDLSGAQWWMGEGRGWVAQAEVGPSGPMLIIDDAGAEASVHFERRVRRYLHVATYGFGDAWIGIRTAAALTGPWSEPRRVYSPPERQLPRPFIYAAIAHPELTPPQPHELLVTYATNSFDFAELLTGPGAERLYWPRVITVDLRWLEEGPR